MARILVVDDAAFMRGSLEFILKKAGHEVVGSCSNGEEAINRFKELKPELVTMDILMKTMDGLTTLQKIREMAPDAKVIMVTALGQGAKIEEARKLGASGYIRKPFKQQEITEEVERVLTEKNAEPGVGS